MLELLNNSQIKIIEEIYKNPKLSLRDLIKKTRLSPNYVSKYINSLIKRNIVKEEKLEKKRVYLRRFYLNFESNLTENLFMLVQSEKKEKFFEEYPKLKAVFEQLNEEIKGLEIVLIYGSYARLTAEKESDLDILIIGKIKNKERIREILVSLDIEVSIIIENLNAFQKRIKDDLHKQILRDNILIFDKKIFFKLLKKHYKS